MKPSIIALITNYKGKSCLYQPILCQEGYCSECNIYEEWCKIMWEDCIINGEMGDVKYGL